MTKTSTSVAPCAQPGVPSPGRAAASATMPMPSHRTAPVARAARFSGRGGHRHILAQVAGRVTSPPPRRAGRT
jgi:hypothetical protein